MSKQYRARRLYLLIRPLFGTRLGRWLYDALPHHWLFREV